MNKMLFKELKSILGLILLALGLVFSDIHIIPVCLIFIGIALGYKLDLKPSLNKEDIHYAKNLELKINNDIPQDERLQPGVKSND